MKSCTPLYAFVILVFLAHLIPSLVRYKNNTSQIESFISHTAETSESNENSVNSANSHGLRAWLDTLKLLITYKTLRSTLYFLIVCYLIYQTCVHDNKVNPSWFIVILYVIWVLLEVILGAIFTLLLKFKTGLKSLSKQGILNMKKLRSSHQYHSS